MTVVACSVAGKAGASLRVCFFAVYSRDFFSLHSGSMVTVWNPLTGEMLEEYSTEAPHYVDLKWHPHYPSVFVGSAHNRVCDLYMCNSEELLCLTRLLIGS